MRSGRSDRAMKGAGEKGERQGEREGGVEKRASARKEIALRAAASAGTATPALLSLPLSHLGRASCVRVRVERAARRCKEKRPPSFGGCERDWCVSFALGVGPALSPVVRGCARGLRASLRESRYAGGRGRGEEQPAGALFFFTSERGRQLSLALLFSFSPFLLTQCLPALASPARPDGECTITAHPHVAGEPRGKEGPLPSLFSLAAPMRRRRAAAAFALSPPPLSLSHTHHAHAQVLPHVERLHGGASWWGRVRVRAARRRLSLFFQPLPRPLSTLTSSSLSTSQCVRATDDPRKCKEKRDDYLECLHHRKEVNG